MEYLKRLLMGSVIMHAPDDDGSVGILELDSSLADAEKPPEIPAGVYVGEVMEVQEKDAQSGNRYYSVKFVIPPENLPADIRDQWEDGCSLYWNRNIIPTAKDRRALFNLRRLIEALGLDTNTSTVDPNEWMGRSARLRVVHGKYQGEVRAEVRSVEPAEPEAATRRGTATPETPKGKKAPARGARK